MTIDELFQGDSVAQPRLRYRGNSPMIAMEAVIHLHLAPVLLQDGRGVLDGLLLRVRVVRLSCDAQLLAKASIILVLSIVYIFRLFAAERCQHLFILRILVDLLEVCLLRTSHCLKVSYVV